MPRYFACDHCGRAGDVTLGVYYPDKDISKPPVRLCQTYQGNPVTPNCYHLVVELGEPLGYRKENAIMETDRQSPKAEGAAIRFTEDVATGTVYADRVTAAQEAGTTPYGEVVQQEHELTGERIPAVAPEFALDPAVTKAEEAKGIINPQGANQRPLVDPGSSEGQAIADAAAAEQARKITVPASGPRINAEGQTVEFPRPPENQPISPSDMVYGSPQPGPVVDTAHQGTTIDPAGNIVFENDSSPEGQSPAQVAAEAQAKADAEEAAKRDKLRASAATQAGDPDVASNPSPSIPDRPADDGSGRSVTEKEADDQAERARQELAKAPAKKAPAKKTAAKKAQAKATGQTSGTGK